jgi:predicted XRE-type DNA-binding protein
MNRKLNSSDILLIQKFILWCKDRGFNQTRIALIAGRTRGWASLLVNGKIKTLNFDTRTTIEKILGVTNGLPSHGEGNGQHSERL